MADQVHSFKLNIKFTSVHCGQCGGTYMLDSRYYDRCYFEGDSWNCPYCGTSWGFGGGEKKRLKAELDKARRRAALEKNWRKAAEAQAEHNERRRRAEKAAKTRIKNRVQHGVCPCCNRSFENLQRHMADKHPHWGTDND